MTAKQKSKKFLTKGAKLDKLIELSQVTAKQKIKKVLDKRN